MSYARDQAVPHLNFSPSIHDMRDPMSQPAPHQYESYPPLQCLSVPLSRRRNSSPHVRSAPQFCGGTNFVRDQVFFGETEDGSSGDDQISYHQRKHSQYPTVPKQPESPSRAGMVPLRTEKEEVKTPFSCVDNSSPCSSGSFLPPTESHLRQTPSSAPTSNPWRRRSRTRGGWTPLSTRSTGSALIPKVVPVSVRVTRMLKEFSMEFYEALTTTDQLAHINKSVRESITEELRNIVKATSRSPRISSPQKSPMCRKPGTDIVHTALLGVTKSIFEEGIDVESFSRKARFLGNLSFIGLMCQYNILDQNSITNALVSLCKHHDQTRDPTYLEGIDRLVKNSDLRPMDSSEGMKVHEYLYTWKTNYGQRAVPGELVGHSDPGRRKHAWPGHSHFPDDRERDDGFFGIYLPPLPRSPMDHRPSPLMNSIPDLRLW